jgi:hypothetical protein
MVYWPKEKQWFPGRVISATANAAEVRYDDGDSSLVAVSDRWKLEEEGEPLRVQRGKVRWGAGTGSWYDVKKREGRWVFVEGGLEVAKASLKTLVCKVAELDTYGAAADDKMNEEEEEEEEEEEYIVDDDPPPVADEEETVARKKIKPLPPRPGEDSAAAKRKRKAAKQRERLPVQRCGVDGCEFQARRKDHFKQHQARVHGIGEVDVEELRRKKAAYERDRKARQPAQRCGVDGCEFLTNLKGNLKRHQARVHGIGDVDAEQKS